MSLLKEKIVVKLYDYTTTITKKEIVYIDGSGLISKVHLESGDIKHINKPLGYFHRELMNDFLFFKPNDFCLINLNFLKQYSIKNQFISIHSDEKIPLSVKYKKAFSVRVRELYNY